MAKESAMARRDSLYANHAEANVFVLAIDMPLEQENIQMDSLQIIQKSEGQQD